MDRGLASIQEMIGQELGVSEWVEMTQEKFDVFAEVTGDKDWLHNDPERCAKESPFSTTIAQGHLLLAHLSKAAEELMPCLDALVYALNYGYDRVRMVRPVPVSSRIRVRLKLMGIRPRGENEYVIKNEAVIEVEGSAHPHLFAEWLFYVNTAR